MTTTAVNYRSLLLFIASAALIAGVAESAAAQALSTSSLPTEISASADAWSWIAPDTARIIVKIEASGQTAEQAAKAVEGKKQAILSRTLPLAKDLKIVTRDITLSPSQAKGSSAPSAAVQMEHTLGIQTKELEVVPKIVDACISGGASLVGVEYSVESGEQLVNKAIAEATEQAAEKAELIAKQLGVSLGRLLSANAIEEPSGAIRRMKNQFGRDLSQARDEDIHVIVTLRYEVKVN